MTASSNERVTMTDIVLGPVVCHDCHAPAMFRTTNGWCQRDYVLRGKALVAVYVPHRCTARAGQPMYEFTSTGKRAHT